jgi:Galactose oxidase, central domain
MSDTWMFKDNLWTQLSPPVSPSARWGAGIAYDAADGYVVLFGGYCEGTTTCNDTWAFKAGQWTELSPALSPSPREYPAMTYDSESGDVLLFGGGNGGSTVYSDTWTFKGGQWSQSSPSVSPSARAGASLVDDTADGYLVMFGGTTNYTCVCGLGDTWKFADGDWTEPSPANGPSSRYSYSFAYDPAIGAALLFGGWNANGGCGNNTDDTWDFHAGNWTELSPTSSPSTRQGSALDYDPSTGGALLFGGVNGTCGVSPTLYEDTWQFG